MTDTDLLPADRSALVSLRTMCVLFDCSRMAVWRRVRSGHFPEPRKFLGRSYWTVGEVREIQAAIERGELAGHDPAENFGDRAPGGRRTAAAKKPQKVKRSRRPS